MKQQLAQLSLYRWRYAIGYGLLGVLFVLSVTTAGLYTPGGITQSEIDTIARTNQLADGILAQPNLPFHALQLASFSLFGVSILSIKLPAILLSTISAVAIFFLLRRWFKPNIAILSMLIMFATGQFIFLAQNATPHILYVTYSALILLFASLILQRAKGKYLWMIGLGASLALSLYTPYFAYINLGLLIAAFIHPHPRHYLLKRTERFNWALAALAGIALTIPLIHFSIRAPELPTELLGLHLANIDILANLKLLLQSYFWVQPIVVDGQIVPILSFTSLALIIFGIIVLFRHRYTARSYVIAAWLLLTLPVLIFSPRLTAIIVVPLFILLAMGVEALLTEWYKLFPNNPYARGVGLVFAIALISTMIITGADRYMNSYRHLPHAAREFSTDISLLAKELRARPAKTELLVNHAELPVYDAMSRHGAHQLVVTTSPDALSTQNILMTHDARIEHHPNDWELQRIVTNDRREHADRFYLYKPQ